MRLVSAALRHVRDAEHLVAEGPHASPDQAYHLAGYGPECTRKATLSVRWFDKAIGHRFDESNEDALEFAIALVPLAERYAPRRFGMRFPALSRWREDVRYHETGACDRAEAERCVCEAREATNDLLFAMWADGRLRDEGGSW